MRCDIPECRRRAGQRIVRRTERKKFYRIPVSRAQYDFPEGAQWRSVDVSKALAVFLRHEGCRMNVMSNECCIYDLEDAAWAVTKRIRGGHRWPVEPRELLALIALHDERNRDGTVQKCRYMAMVAAEPNEQVDANRYGPLDHAAAYNDGIRPTHICAIQGHSQLMKIEDLCGVWSDEIIVGDEIWHGTKRENLESIWQYGLTPGGVGRQKKSNT